MEENLKEKLFKPTKAGWERADEREREAIFNLSKKYMNFLNVAKTEREFIKQARKMADENGYRDIIEFETLKPGDKVYFVNRDKSMYLAIIGEKPIEDGLHIIGSHVDSPRLDLKPNPLYEDTGLAYFKTHYYGGIKKYQWTTIPLSMHGVIVKTNGEKVEVNIGEEENDPIFTITDLLPHLAQDQMEKKLKNGVEGENLNLLIGSIPYEDDKVSEKVKLNILNILNQKYGITEIDFTSSEIELVPAFRARSLGFDGSMVAAYGQDDKVCAYTSLHAMMELENVKNTAVCILSDKEEIGSMGNTGMESHVFDTFISELLKGQEFRVIGGCFEKFTDSILDIEGVINWAKNQGYEEIILEGHSYGCNKVLYYYHQNKDQNIKKIVLLAPCDIPSEVKKYLSKEEYEKAYPILKQAEKIEEKSKSYINEEFAWNDAFYDLFSLAAFYSAHYKEAIIYLKKAIELNPHEERYQKNLILMEPYSL